MLRNDHGGVATVAKNQQHPQGQGKRRDLWKSERVKERMSFAAKKKNGNKSGNMQERRKVKVKFARETGRQVEWEGGVLRFADGEKEEVPGAPYLPKS